MNHRAPRAPSTVVCRECRTEQSPTYSGLREETVLVSLHPDGRGGVCQGSWAPPLREALP